jgi:NitT/TauT family transport system substrate-binding protein
MKTSTESWQLGRPPRAWRIVKFALVVWFISLAGTPLLDAATPTRIRFAIDWNPGSYHSPFLIALYKGYYSAEGLEVTIDRGKGSAQVVAQVLSGVYDMGFPDINVLIDFNARNPQSDLRMIMMGYEQYPSGIFTLKSSGISQPKELEGRTLGPSVNDSTFKLWPVFAKIAGVDPNKVKIIPLDPSLREAMLARGSVDAITGQSFRSIIDLMGRGVPSDQIVKFMYKDYGLDLYGNGVVASQAFLQQRPEAARAFLRATIRGVKAMVADPDLAIEMLIKYEPLLTAKAERSRLDIALDCCLITPNVRKNGYGGVDEPRLESAIALISKTYDLPRQPKPKEIFDASFLPPIQERIVR